MKNLYQTKTNVLLLILVAFVNAAFGANVSMTAGPVCFYLEKTTPGALSATPEGDRRTWNLFNPRTNETRRYLTTEQSPYTTVFDLKQRCTYFSPGDPIYFHQWGAAPSSLKTFPKSPYADKFQTMDMWIDQTSNNLRVAYFIAVPPNDVIKKGTSTFFRWDGKLIDASGLNMSSKMRDGFETPFEPGIAVIEELSGNQWKQVSVLAISMNGAAYSLGKLFEERPDTLRLTNAPVLYLTNEIKNEPLTMSGGSNSDKFPAEVSNNLNSKARMLMESLSKQTEDGEYTIGYLPLPDRQGFLFRQYIGDHGLQDSLPIYFCSDNCSKTEKLTGMEGRENEANVQISKKDEFLMVIFHDLVNNKPETRIYKAGVKEPLKILPGIDEAVWLPTNQIGIASK